MTVNCGQLPLLPNCIYGTVTGFSHFAPLLVAPFQRGNPLEKLHL